MICQKIKKQLSEAKLLGFDSILVSELSNTHLLDLKECGFIVTEIKDDYEEGILYKISY